MIENTRRNEDGRERTLRVFEDLFPEESDCMEELVNLISKGRVKCGDCGSDDVNRTYGDRACACKECGRVFSVTAGTFFNRIRSARPWLLALFLLQEKIEFNAAELQRFTGIAYSTAFSIMKKFAEVIIGLFTGEELVSDLEFKKAVGKRSNRSPVLVKPSKEFEEQYVLGSGLECTILEEEDIKRELDLLDKLGDNEKEVLCNLSEQAVSLDKLSRGVKQTISELCATLVMLELKGQVISLPGNLFKRVRRGASRNWQESVVITVELVNRVVDFVNKVYQKVSRKYLGHYVAMFNWFEAKDSMDKSLLMKVCVDYGYLSSKEIERKDPSFQVRVCRQEHN